MTHIYAMAHNAVSRFGTTTAKIFFSPNPIDESQFTHGIGLVRLDFDAEIANPIDCNIDIVMEGEEAAWQIRAMSDAVLARRPSGGYLTVAQTEALLGISLAWIAPIVQKAIMQYIQVCNTPIIEQPKEMEFPLCGRGTKCQ